MYRSFCYFILVFALFFQICFASRAPVGAPLTIQQWHQCERYIEEKAFDIFAKGHAYIHYGKNLPCSIEKDPATDVVYIHLKNIQEAFLGRGAFKCVTKSILFGKNPTLVARCQGGKSLKIEAEVLEKLQNVTGIIQLKSFIQHSHDRCELMLEYCNAGTLRGLESGRLTIQKNELLSVMRDLIIGLESLHKAGYIHRDLKRDNVLFHRENDVLKAVLTDFGLALKMDERKKARISVQDTVCAPEVLLGSTQYIERKKAEAYSLGAILYYIIFSARPVWWDSIDQDECRFFSHEKKLRIYQRIQYLYNKTVFEVPEKKSQRIDLIRLVLKLLNPNPKNRISLDRAHIEIDAIAQKWSAGLSCAIELRSKGPDLLCMSLLLSSARFNWHEINLLLYPKSYFISKVSVEGNRYHFSVS